MGLASFAESLPAMTMRADLGMCLAVFWLVLFLTFGQRSRVTIQLSRNVNYYIRVGSYGSRIGQVFFVFSRLSESHHPGSGYLVVYPGSPISEAFCLIFSCGLTSEILQRLLQS
jgi:hypothetical protein